MHASQRPLEFLGDPREWNLKRGAPSDQNVIMSATHLVSTREPHYFAQAAAYPISLNRVADFLRHGKAQTHRPAIHPLACL